MLPTRFIRLLTKLRAVHMHAATPKDNGFVLECLGAAFPETPYGDAYSRVFEEEFETWAPGECLANADQNTLIGEVKGLESYRYQIVASTCKHQSFELAKMLLNDSDCPLGDKALAAIRKSMGTTLLKDPVLNAQFLAVVLGTSIEKVPLPQHVGADEAPSASELFESFDGRNRSEERRISHEMFKHYAQVPAPRPPAGREGRTRAG
jgi:hypothetical protein